MSYFLTIHTTYSSIKIGISKNNSMLFSSQEETKKASQNCIVLIEDLLKKACLSIKDLSCLIIYKGPAPFTTLRVSIASCNGLAYAHNIPLIGIDGLACFAKEQKDRNFSQTIVLLNAFGKDLYTAIYDTEEDSLIYNACMSLENLLLHIREHNKPIKCVGNGASLYTQELIHAAPGKVFIPENNPETCSLESLLAMGFKLWEQGSYSFDQVIPLYLKNHPAQKLSKQ